MEMTSNKLKNSWLLTPILGSILFVFLYINATLLYPGGSQFDKQSVGFSWTNNYCYYSKDLIIYLPVIQKVSFAFFLIWICSICIFLFLRAEKGNTYQ